MGASCVTADHLTFVCSLDANLMDWAGVLVQAVWFIGGGLLALAAVIAIATFFRRV